MYLLNTPFCKTNSISDEEIFDKDKDKYFYNEQLDITDPSRLNQKTDLYCTFDSNLFANYNQTINKNDMTYYINEDDLYYTNPKNENIFPVAINEENELETNKSKTSISNRNNFGTQKKKKKEKEKRGNVKLGRKTKKEKEEKREKGEISDNKNVHSKESLDNIRTKFKRLFFKNLNVFLNNILKKSKNRKLNSLRFKKLNSEYIQKLTKKHNLEMLDSPAFVVLSEDIAKKFKRYNRDHNKKIIDLIYEENEESLMSVLNKSIGQLMKIFCSAKEDKKEEDLFKEYKRLDEYIENYKNNLSEDEKDKKDAEDYFEIFKKEGENFEKSIKSIAGRNRKIAPIST